MAPIACSSTLAPKGLHSPSGKRCSGHVRELHATLFTVLRIRRALCLGKQCFQLWWRHSAWEQSNYVASSGVAFAAVQLRYIYALRQYRERPALEEPSEGAIAALHSQDRQDSIPIEYSLHAK